MFKTHNWAVYYFYDCHYNKNHCHQVTLHMFLCVLFELLSALYDAENESRSAAGHDGFGWLAWVVLFFCQFILYVHVCLC